MTYHIGQQVALDYSRKVTGDKMQAPEWYALLVLPQKERATREALKAKGIHSCFPERETSYRTRGKKVTRKFPIVSQIVYAKFESEPQWDVLKYRRMIRGVFSYGDIPIIIPGDVVRAVMGLPTVAEELEQARRELLRVREGDKAKLVSGPFEGFTVDIERVSEGRAWFSTITGVQMQASVDMLEREPGKG